MKDTTYELFKNASLEQITEILATELEKRNESPFWKERVVPFSQAILSILIPLKEQDLLFNPEGQKVDELTPELFFRWADFVSLKTLAFTIQKSNEANKLLRTKLDEGLCSEYKNIDIKDLANYLSQHSVNLEDENLDFPISNYNLHQGVCSVIKSLL